MRSLRLTALAHVAALAGLLLAPLPAALADDAPEAPAATPAPHRSPQPSPAQLWAAVERAWNSSDASELASLCDSALVRVSLKPGGSPASAPTLSAVAFLIHDQLDLVAIRGFRVLRFDADLKKRTSRARARWVGDWGGGKGVRDLEVLLAAAATVEGQWLLTEIRTTD
ncbi:MAG TPA: hypothetical protein VFT32_13185 [Candidatus Eisenbacteria bacterium]|nr:hypothetical protein [Candidatus Eisenbacteria bacterium]